MGGLRDNRVRVADYGWGSNILPQPIKFEHDSFEGQERSLIICEDGLESGRSNGMLVEAVIGKIMNRKPLQVGSVGSKRAENRYKDCGRSKIW